MPHLIKSQTLAHVSFCLESFVYHTSKRFRAKNQLKIKCKKKLESDNTELSQFLFSCFILDLFALKVLLGACLHAMITTNSSLMNKRRESGRKTIGKALRALGCSFWDGH